jgi:hypothetical protein
MDEAGVAPCLLQAALRSVHRGARDLGGVGSGFDELDDLLPFPCTGQAAQAQMSHDLLTLMLPDLLAPDPPYCDRGQLRRVALTAKEL